MKPTLDRSMLTETTGWADWAVSSASAVPMASASIGAVDVDLAHHSDAPDPSVGADFNPEGQRSDTHGSHCRSNAPARWGDLLQGTDGSISVSSWATRSPPEHATITSTTTLSRSITTIVADADWRGTLNESLSSSSGSAIIGIE